MLLRNPNLFRFAYVLSHAPVMSTSMATYYGILNARRYSIDKCHVSLRLGPQFINAVPTECGIRLGLDVANVAQWNGTKRGSSDVPRHDR